MRGRDFRGVVQNLAAMAVSSRIKEDLETLGMLPDGVMRVDLIAGTAQAADRTAVSLQLGQNLWSWLGQQALERGFKLAEIVRAEVLIHTDTSRTPTNRASIVSFDLRAITTLVRLGREYRAESVNHMWHDRTPNRSMRATCEDART